MSAEGTYCVGTQWAAPSVQQLGRLDGVHVRRAACRRIHRPIPTRPVVDRSVVPGGARPVVTAPGEGGARQVDVRGAPGRRERRPRGRRRARRGERLGAWCRSAPVQGADHVSEVDAGRTCPALLRARNRVQLPGANAFPSPSIAKPEVSTGLSRRGRRKDGDPPWRIDAPCSADFFSPASAGDVRFGRGPNEPTAAGRRCGARPA